MSSGVVFTLFILIIIIMAAFLAATSSSDLNSIKHSCDMYKNSRVGDMPVRCLEHYGVK